MEQKPIIPYSRLVGDDGALDKAKEDLDKFAKYVEKIANELKGSLGSIDIKDAKGLQNQSKAVDELADMQKEYYKALDAVNKSEQLNNKLKKEARKLNTDANKLLDELNIELEQHKVALKVTNQLEKDGLVTVEEAAVARGRLKVLMRELTGEIKKQEKEIIQGNTLTVKETKLLKAKLTVQNKEIETVEKIRERIAALRIVVQNTNLTTDEGRKAIADYNKEIDELTDVLGENSDKFIKNKINVGNYTESIKKALDETELFKTGIGALDFIMEKVIDAMFDSKEATDANTKALTSNTKSVGILTEVNGFFARIFKKNAVVVSENTAAVATNTTAVDAETVAITENTAATQVNTTATNTNTAATTKNTGAVRKLIDGFKGLNKVLKGTIIVAAIALFGSLFAIFRQGRAGVVATEKVMQRFAVIAKVTIATFADFGKGLIGLFVAIGTSLGNLFDKFERIGLKLSITLAKPLAFTAKAKQQIVDAEKELAILDKRIAENAKNNGKAYLQSFSQMGKAVSSFKSRYQDAVAAIKSNDEAIIRAFQIGDEIKKAELALIRLNKIVRGLEMMGDDDTFSLTTQLEATRLAMIQRIKLMRQEVKISALQLEQANAKARADLLANASSIGASANRIAAIKDEARFAEELLQLNIDLDERKGENVLDDEALNESIEALKNYKNALVEIEIAKQENAEKLRKIDRDIFEQNLDLLIDLVDKEKQLSEQQVNSTILNYEKRLEEFNRFRAKFKDNAQKELDEFNKLAIKSARLLRDQLKDSSLSPVQIKLIRAELEKLENLDINIKFDADDSFKVFNGDVEFSLDNIQELNKQLQSVGLAEIPINRFREFVQETSAWLKDTKDLNLELQKVGNTIKEMQEGNLFSEEQLRNLRQINLEIQNLSDPKDLSVFAYDKQLKRIEELEKKKTKIIEEAEMGRLQLRLNALNREQEFYEKQAEALYLIQKKKRGDNSALTEEEIKDAHKNSEELLKITEERLAIQSQMIQSNLEKNLEKNKEDTEKLKAQWERFKKDLFGVFDTIADKFVEMANKQVKTSEDRIAKQEKATDEQRARAAAGLENTLAFEQEQLAKREAEAARARKKAERLEKIKALWVSYQSYASDPENKSGEALSKTLRDFAILQAIQASFGDGGLIADKVPTDGRGMIRGRSHKGNGGGIPVMVEGNEGILSRANIENMGGADSFRAFKSMLDKGRISPSLFQNQKNEFTKSMPIVIDNRGIEKGLEDVRNEIRNKPTEGIRAEELVNVFKLIHEKKTPNKTVRTNYIIKKNKF